MGEYSPKISVLMAVYNAEKFIRRSVESVLCQTFRDFELICVDDGSQDASLDILKEYAKRDHRLKIVANPHQGACETLNECLMRATGEYITFIDNDDEYHPRTLEMAHKVIAGQKFDVVIWDWMSVDEGVENIDRPFPTITNGINVAPIDDYIGWSLDNKHVSFWCKIYSRKALLGMKFVPDVIHGDIVFQWQLFLRAPLNVGHIPCCLYKYFVRGESMDHRPMTAAMAVDGVKCVRSIAMGKCYSIDTIKRLKGMLTGMIWSGYKNGRKFPQFREYVLHEIRQLFAENILSWKDVPFVRRLKMQLAVLSGKML